MTFTLNGLVYETINNDNEVNLRRTEGLKRPVRNIPAEVEYSGKKYKLTEVHGGYYLSGAFEKDDVLTNLSLPETIRSINSGKYDYPKYHGAFSGCIKLKEIYFSDSLESIGENAFYGCTAIESLYFGDNLKTIGKSAFDNCSALKEIDFNDKLETICDYAFRDCASLKNVSFPESLKKIGYSAFKGCKAMTEVNIPASVETIGSEAFAESGVKVVNIYSENINIASDAFPADAQINFLDANSFPKRKRKPRGAKTTETPKATHVVEEPKKEEPKPQPKPAPKPEPMPEPMKKTPEHEMSNGNKVVEQQEDSQEYDRAYWIERSSEQNLGLVDHLLDIINSVCQDRYELKYNKAYIGITHNSKPRVFVAFRPQKGDLQISVYVKQTPEFDKIFAEKLDSKDSYKDDKYKCHIQVEDTEKKGGFFAKLIGKTASNLDALKPVLIQAEKEAK